MQPGFRGDARREGGSSAGDGIPDQVKEALGLNPDAANGDTDDAGAMPETILGDAGLDYRHGYVQLRLHGSGPATTPWR